MIGTMNKTIHYILLAFFSAILISCGKDSDDENHGPIEEDEPKWNFETEPLPQFISTNYIDVSQIKRISKFRSSEGHEYVDSYERERSMKHYFVPLGWDYADSISDDSPINIVSPISGTVFIKWDESEGAAGQQIWITSDDYPAFNVIIFHVWMPDSIQVGDHVSEGQILGHHVRGGTWSDIAVSGWTDFDGNDDGHGIKLVSYFDAITDEVFDEFRVFEGVENRSDFIISKEVRDQYPGFRDFPWQESWIYLH